MLPTVIVIGAAKCGTTSVHEYLDDHPEVAMSAEKELNFFVEEKNWPRGIAWYESQFDPDAPVRGESSPTYTAYPEYHGVPERIRSVVPDAKLIYLVRFKGKVDAFATLGEAWVTAGNLAGARVDGLAPNLTP